MGNSKKKQERLKAERRAKHERLLRLFDGDGYEEFHTPKYIFVKQKNNNNDTWEVAIYSKESWLRREQGKAKHLQGALSHLQAIKNEDF